MAAAAGGQLTPASLELGGKSALLVFADTDLDLAVANAVEQYDNAGQVCLAGSRLLVQEPIAAEFTARLLDRIAALRQGDPRDEDTDIGPNISRAHVQRVDGFVRRAVTDGARVLAGGGVRRGLYYQPTLLTGARPGAEILTAEVFGPVLTLQTFDTEDEAVGLANNTSYGLAATLFTGDRARAERVAARLVRGHRVGELLLRPGSARAVRRRARLRHRPRGRDLELRFLQRRQEHRLRTEGLAQ